MDVRAEILRCATRLLAKHGFDGTSLQAIADEVGVRKPSVLYHFPSKEAVRQGVLDQLFDHWAQTLPRLMQAIASGDGRFDALIFEMLDFFRADPDRARLLVREALDRPHEMRARLKGTLTPWVTLIADYVRKGQEGGALQSDVDPESYIVHIITLTLSALASFDVLSTALAGPGVGAPRERHIQELLRIARTSLFEPKKRSR
jgi:TetR/AcrR family transcriptional regulator